MRDIIFRGTSKYTNKMMYGSLIQYKDSVYKIKSYDGFYEVYEDTIGQFTGRYDVNKIPIYEGDTIHKTPYTPNINVLYDVVFMDGCFQLQVQDTATYLPIPSFCTVVAET